MSPSGAGRSRGFRVLWTYLRELTGHEYDGQLASLFHQHIDTRLESAVPDGERRLVALPAELRSLVWQIVADMVGGAIFGVLRDLEDRPVIEMEGEEYEVRLHCRSLKSGEELEGFDLSIGYDWFGWAPEMTSFRGTLFAIGEITGDYPNVFAASRVPVEYRVARLPNISPVTGEHPLSVEGWCAGYRVGAVTLLAPEQRKANTLPAVDQGAASPLAPVPRPAFEVPPGVLAAALQLKPGQAVRVDRYGRRCSEVETVQ